MTGRRHGVLDPHRSTNTQVGRHGAWINEFGIITYTSGIVNMVTISGETGKRREETGIPVHCYRWDALDLTAGIWAII